MMKQAIKYCSKVFSNDNPRNEDPKKIVKDTIKGLNQNKLKVTVIYDRKSNTKGNGLLKPQDTLLVAGKDMKNVKF